MSDTHELNTRVALLEQIAADTKEALAGIRAEMRELRADLRAEMRDSRADVRELRAEVRTDYRWLLGIMLGMGGGLLAAMAKGFHWL